MSELSELVKDFFSALQGDHLADAVLELEARASGIQATSEEDAGALVVLAAHRLQRLLSFERSRESYQSEVQSSLAHMLGALAWLDRHIAVAALADELGLYSTAAQRDQP